MNWVQEVQEGWRHQDNRSFKLIIAGGRKYKLTKDDYQKLENILFVHSVTEVVSGLAEGADACGEAWAKIKGIKIQPFPAPWGLYPGMAGRVRNGRMARYADAVALFPGGSGTHNMYDQAVTNKLMIFDYRRKP